jgi:hypothetical protein
MELQRSRSTLGLVHLILLTPIFRAYRDCKKQWVSTNAAFGLCVLGEWQENSVPNLHCEVYYTLGSAYMKLTNRQLTQKKLGSSSTAK